MRNPERAIVWSVAGQAMTALAQLVILSALARVGGPSLVGEYGLAMAILTPIFNFAGFGLQVLIASDVNRQHTLPSYIGFASAAVFTAVSAVLALIFFDTVPGEVRLLLIILMVVKVAEVFSNICFGFFQREGQSSLVGRLQSYKAVTSAIVFTTVIIFGSDVYSALASYMVTNLIFMIVIELRFVAKLGSTVTPIFDVAAIILLWRSALPLAWANLMAGLTVAGPRMSVFYLMGLEALGIFTVLSYFSRVGLLLSQAVTQALLTKLARLRADGAADRYRQVLFPLKVGFPSFWLATLPVNWLCGEYLMVRVFGTDFDQVSLLFYVVGLTLSVQSVALLLQLELQAVRRFLTLARDRTILALTTLVLSYIGGALYGLMGVVTSLLLVAIVQLLQNHRSLSRYTASPGI